MGLDVRCWTQGGLETEWYRRLIRLAIASKESVGNVDSALHRWALGYGA